MNINMNKKNLRYYIQKHEQTLKSALIWKKMTKLYKKMKLTTRKKKTTASLSTFDDESATLIFS